MRDTQQDGSQLISGLNSEKTFLETATYPIRFLLKFYETTMMEVKEITVQPSKGIATWTRADVGKRVIVREPLTSEFGFHELPVSESGLCFSVAWGFYSNI